ncbi:hypothetical protein ACOI1C_09280 [Bacillus sp. DJP31]|uniref:hypothetical protein n=1 Tax=Bacillus sp. DJP31 TaxID=3409789 RepID=UPI003BB4AC4F
MTMLTAVLSVLALLILVIGFFYTMKIAKNTKYQTGGYDTEINEKVQDHPFIRNPIFLAYLVAASLIIAFIAYYALSSKW